MTNAEKIKLFTDLVDNKVKTVQLNLRGCMGGSTDGLVEFRRYRKNKAKSFSGPRGSMTRQAITLLAPGQTKVSAHRAYKLWLTTRSDGSATLSASIGNMGLMISEIIA